MLFIGTDSGIEKEVVKGEGFLFQAISAKGFMGMNFVEKTKFPFYCLLGTIQSLIILYRFQVDVVVGTGGFLSIPVVFAALSSGIPIVLLALDTIPSKTVRILSSLVDEVYISFEESSKWFPNAKSIKITGNPVRKNLSLISKEMALEFLGLDKSKRTILILGGSRGAHSLNVVGVAALPFLSSRDEIQVVWQTGKDDFNWVVGEAKRVGLKSRIEAFFNKMEMIYPACDLAISRAGATTLAELAVVGIPSILIPYPFASENHQEHNARYFERNGACIVVLNREWNEKRLEELISFLLENNEKLSEMRKRMLSLGRASASVEIVDNIFEIIEKKRK